MSNGNGDKRFVTALRRQAERQGRRRSMSFWEGLSLVGAVGWMVSLPAVAGALLGHWIDRSLGRGYGWTLSLLLTGLAAGVASAWRHVYGELHR